MRTNDLIVGMGQVWEWNPFNDEEPDDVYRIHSLYLDEEGSTAGLYSFKEEKIVNANYALTSFNTMGWTLLPNSEE